MISAPRSADHFLIHYVLSGNGKFHVGDKVYTLHKGQGFLIHPGIVTYYRADGSDPWVYSWVGFHGLKAEFHLKNAGLTPENPVFTYDNDNYITLCFEEMISSSSLQKGRELRLLGLLYLFISQLVEVNGKDQYTYENGRNRESYIKKAIEYVEMNYSRKMHISDIAKHVGLVEVISGPSSRNNCILHFRNSLYNTASIKPAS